MALRDGLILGLCNPLLDISTKVDPVLLQKYDLKANSAILGDETHLKIYDELNKDEIEYIPGGSGQNALRTASWILKHPNVAVFMGCTGKDENAEIMRQKAKEVGLTTAYQVDEKAPTGTCAVLITGNDRSLVAHLGAANNFTADHLNNEDSLVHINNAEVYYITGFFFTVCPEAILRVSKVALEKKRTLCINLSAPFLSQFFKERLLEAFPYVDIVFGNDDEAKAFAKNALNLETENVEEIVKAISEMPKLNERKRLVIITQGDRPVVYYDGSVTKQIPVPPLEPSKIVDTNGAGDAFVGGFLSQFVKGHSIEKSIDCGIWVSQLVVQRSGCTFPDTMNYN